MTIAGSTFTGDPNQTPPPTGTAVAPFANVTVSNSQIQAVIYPPSELTGLTDATINQYLAGIQQTLSNANITPQARATAEEARFELQAELNKRHPAFSPAPATPATVPGTTTVTAAATSPANVFGLASWEWGVILVFVVGIYLSMKGKK